MSIADLVITDPTDLEAAGLGASRIRETKTALKEAFPAVDGEITNSGALEVAGDTNPPDAATFSKLFEDVRALQENTAGVPLGSIVQWSLALNGAIPTGWTDCDGSGSLNGIVVPDMRDRFIMSAGQTFADNDTPGGSSTSSSGGAGSIDATLSIGPHTIELDNLPQHQHHAFANVIANNTVSAHTLTGANTAAATGVGQDADRKYMMDSDSSTGATVGLTSFDGGVQTVETLTHADVPIQVDGIEHTHEVISPYYPITYIIRVGV
jgi:hypothetical protein